jgi:hypothetical protein
LTLCQHYIPSCDVLHALCVLAAQVPSQHRLEYGVMGDNVRHLRLQVKKWMDRVRDLELTLRTTVEMVAELACGLDGAEKGRAFTASERSKERRIQQTIISELLTTEPAMASFYRDYDGMLEEVPWEQLLATSLLTFKCCNSTFMLYWSCRSHLVSLRHD